MIDVTDTCFRRLVKTWGRPDVLYSEFVSADTWCREGFEVPVTVLFPPNMQFETINVGLDGTASTKEVQEGKGSVKGLNARDKTPFLLEP